LPGGRLEQGESYEEGFVREVKEETGLDVELGRPVFVGEWRPVIKGIPHQIIAIFCVGKTTADQVTISNEHDDYAWVDRDSYQDFNYMNPDPEVLQAYFDSLN
jgi:8-oxo-dGTP diphosphatase